MMDARPLSVMHVCSAQLPQSLPSEVDAAFHAGSNKRNIVYQEPVIYI